MGNWRLRVIEGLVIVLAVAVVAHVAWRLLGPLLPSILVLVVLGWIVMFMLKRR